jgi:hypothetical protein
MTFGSHYETCIVWSRVPSGNSLRDWIDIRCWSLHPVRESQLEDSWWPTTSTMTSGIIMLVGSIHIFIGFVGAGN